MKLWRVSCHVSVLEAYEGMNPLILILQSCFYESFVLILLDA